MKKSSFSLVSRRILETVAMAIVGDAVLAILDPNRHVALWRKGPKPWQKSMDAFLERPQLTRALGVAELGLGLWLAESQKLD